MVTNYNPNNPNIKSTIHKNWNILTNSPDCGHLFQDKPLVGFRLSNLRDMLTNSSIRYPSQINAKHTLMPPICTRLGKCTYCPQIKKINTVQCNFTKKSFHLNFLIFFLFGVLRRFQHCTGHIMTGSWKGRGNQYIQFVRVLYCKLPTNGKQLPAFPLQAVTGIEPRPQRWEARVLPLCHRSPHFTLKTYPKILPVNSVMSYISFLAENATNNMLGRPAGHLEKECTSINSQYKKKDRSHQYPVTLKVKDITIKICSQWCKPRFEPTCTSKRRRLELTWIFKLHSLSPIGINQFV